MANTSWEDDLVAELKARESAGSSADDERDALGAAFVALIEAFGAAVARIAEATGGTAAQAGAQEDGRLRWSYAQHVLAVRVDPAAQKIFVSADVGRDVVLEELTTGRAAGDGGAELFDQRGAAVSVDDLTRRFVTLLFRGA